MSASVCLYVNEGVVTGTGVRLCTERELVRAQRIIKKFTHFTLNCNTCFCEGCVLCDFLWSNFIHNGFISENNCFNILILFIPVFYSGGVKILSKTAYT